ncbi:MAG: ABC transporter permease, partial [Nitrosomonadales bacterium]|nr:ABC transporter permease [Nitrosomonadales bacterium]
MKQIALAIILFWTFSLIFKILSGFDSSVMKVDEILVSPNFTDWFGKDDFGRDIYFRLIDGFINSFEIIFYVTLITSILGIFIGVLSGYLGGR